MPIFHSVDEAQKWCSKAFPIETQTQGIHMLSYIKAVTIGDIAIFGAGWVLGRWGWDVVVNAVKSVWSKVWTTTSTVVTEVKSEV